MDLKKYKGKRIACFDYGLKRIGFAVSDELHITTRPVTFFETDDDKLFDKIKEQFLSLDVGLIVLGYPYWKVEKKTEVMEQIGEFKSRLNKIVDCPVVYYDESFTSKEAVKTMIEIGTGKKKRSKKGNIDKTAAAVILKHFLEEMDD